MPRGRPAVKPLGENLRQVQKGRKTAKRSLRSAAVPVVVEEEEVVENVPEPVPDQETTENDESDSESDGGPASVSRMMIAQRKRVRRYRAAKQVLDLPYDDICFPEETSTPKPRFSLKIQYPSDQPVVRGCFDENQVNKCVICEKDDGELIDCRGGVSRKLNCQSKFHVECITKYHDAGFLFQYAARPECQNQLLCPLHCCSACNAENRKQSAYDGRLTECALCLRSFHTDTCIPIGSQHVVVNMAGDGPEKHVAMLICPQHETRKSIKKRNMKICCVCSGNKKLVNCSTCVRAFHAECRETKKIDGVPPPDKACDHCLNNNVIRFNVPAIGRWQSNFYLAIPKPWSQYPAHMVKGPQYGQLGYTVVEWPLENKTAITAVSDLCQLTDVFLPMAHPDVRESWEEALTAFDALARFAPRYKKVHKEGIKSKHFDKTSVKLFQFHECGLCKCTGPNRCTTDDCIYFASDCECPPICEEDGRVCNNRNVSKERQNPNVDLMKAGNKGFGVFATGPISKGAYIAEYVGEIINKAEKEKRLFSVQKSKDVEANRYMMDMADGTTVDAARFGNITRYMNHSCDPNAGAFHVKVFRKNEADGEHSLYDYRTYVKTMRDIAAGEEITFDYGMKSEAVPDCKCGSERCTGRLFTRKATEDGAEELEEEEVEPEVVVPPPTIPVEVPKRRKSIPPRGRRGRKRTRESDSAQSLFSGPGPAPAEEPQQQPILAQPPKRRRPQHRPVAKPVSATRLAQSAIKPGAPLGTSSAIQSPAQPAAPPAVQSKIPSAIHPAVRSRARRGAQRRAQPAVQPAAVQLSVEPEAPLPAQPAALSAIQPEAQPEAQLEALLPVQPTALPTSQSAAQLAIEREIESMVQSAFRSAVQLAAQPAAQSVVRPPAEPGAQLSVQPAAPTSAQREAQLSVQPQSATINQVSVSGPPSEDQTTPRRSFTGIVSPGALDDDVIILSPDGIPTSSVRKPRIGMPTDRQSRSMAVREASNIPVLRSRGSQLVAPSPTPKVTPRFYRGGFSRLPM